MWRRGVRAGERKDVLGDRISQWKPAGTGRPQGFPREDTQTHGRARYHMDHNHLEMVLKIQVPGP